MEAIILMFATETVIAFLEVGEVAIGLWFVRRAIISACAGAGDHFCVG